ncbi:MAG: lysophospholipid acyltransferase family protein [Candidatus Omnitrophica bacterium]|nr:lysophospholipid acyltransferase family protein [Candidatus Omnitrophota bacterium]
MLRFIFFKFFKFLVNVLPLTWSYKAAEGIAKVYCFFKRTEQEAVKRNLLAIDPEMKNLDAASRAVFQNFSCYLVEFLMMFRLVNDKDLGQRFEFRGFEHIEQYVKTGKPAIILTAHIGNWELGGALLAKKGCAVTAVALQHKESLVNNFFDQQRLLCGIEVASTAYAVKECLKALKNNRIVAIVGDKDFTGSGSPADLFGHKIVLPRGAALFAQRAHVPVIPTFLIRQGQGHFVLHVYPPVTPEDIKLEKNKKFGVYEDLIIHQYTEALEDIIKKYPSQWIVFKEFWQS